MSGVVGLVVIFVVFGFILAVIAFLAYRRVLRRAKGIERGLKMVPLLIHLPPPASDSEQQSMRDVRDVMREKASQAQVLYDLISGTAQPGFKSTFYGQRHIAFEIIASNGLVHFFTAVPVAMVSTVEQAVLTAYPGARVEEVEDHNIFNPQGRLSGTVGGELVLKQEYSYPINTLEHMERDPIEALLNALIKLQPGDGAAVQLMLRPASSKWSSRGKFLVAKKRRQRQGTLDFNAADIAKAAVKSPDQWHQESQQYQPSKLEESILQSMEEKMRHPGFEILVRVVASSGSYDRAQMILRNITNSFALYEAPGSNGFEFLEARDIQGLVTAFIFRFFPPEVKSNILGTNELATLFHLPNDQFTASTSVQRQQSKQVDGPVNLPSNGLLLGYNFYRGVKKEIRLSPEDRRRHMYIIGQTGTGKSTILENIAVQDMLSGGGFAFIDPHGDAAERLLSMVPKERAEDVVYFNPADMQQPLGINLFEFDTPEQKDFIIQESINMLYKLYDPDKTGIIGPRFEHWFRNAALTLMADPNGASFVELPKVFTDTEYLKNKFKYLQDPTVIDFWTKEMGQTSDYHKSEMLGWFVSKFGAFQSNDMMRNIIGQTHSAFNIREIMDQKKILIVNLSKGMTGEINSKLLGMIFVIKIQAAAMSRSNILENQRNDFSMIVDEFQNFSTDSFASILSEARKYRLNLIVANQFIGQLSEDIREAVFGNIGTMMSYRCGPEDAEFLVKQFEPLFNERDLINIPNYNAVMKLLIGGLPSQPFSITAMPPLGQAHAEMGLAVKQLSAAKFGVQRATVEADIFARLQNKPRPSLAPPQPTVAATPVVPPATSMSAPAPVSAPAPAPAPAPTAAPVPAPTPVQPVPAAIGATQNPLNSPQPSAPTAPQSDVAATAPTSNTAANIQPTLPSELSLAQVRAGAGAGSTVPTSQPKASQTAAGPKISDIVGPSRPQPTTAQAAPVATAPQAPQIEVLNREESSKSVGQGVNREAIVSEAQSQKPVALIEAHEADGWTDQSQTPAPIDVATKSAPAPEAAKPTEIKPHKPDPAPRATPVPEEPIKSESPAPKVKDELKEELQHDVEEVLGASAAVDGEKPKTVSPPVAQESNINSEETIISKVNDQLEKQVESANHPLIKPRSTSMTDIGPTTMVAAAPERPQSAANASRPPVPSAPATAPGKTMIATHRTPRIPNPSTPTMTEGNVQVDEAVASETKQNTAAKDDAVRVHKQKPANNQPEVQNSAPPAPVTPVPEVPAPEAPKSDSSTEAPVSVDKNEAPTSKGAAASAPKLNPGEIQVDADGNVIQG